MTPSVPSFQVRVASVAVLLAIITASGCSDRAADASDAASASWRSTIAVAGVVHPGCDTVHVARPSSSCGATYVMPAESLGALAARAAVLAKQRENTHDLVATHELGRMELALARDSAAVDRAVSLLREAADGDDSRVDFGIDYSAALLTRYAERRAVRDLLESVDRTTSLVERDPAACWNHAVGLAWLAVREEGAALRARCAPRCANAGCALPVVLDESPAVTADKRAVAASGRYPEAAWEYVWLDAWPRWGAALRTGDTAAASRALNDVRVAAEPLAANGQDSSGVRALTQVLAVRDHTRRLNAARAFELFAEARKARSIVGARGPSALLDSVELATKPSDAIREWATLQRANGWLSGGRPSAALATYREKGAGRVDTATLLGGRLVFNEALAIMATGGTVDALRRLDALTQTCRRANRPECTEFSAGMAAGLAARIDANEQQEFAHESLLSVATNPISSWRWTTLSAQRDLADRLAWSRTAEVLRAEAARVAREIGRPDLEVQDLVIGIKTRLGRGDTARVRRDLDRISGLAETLNQSDRRFQQANILMLSGELRLRNRQPGASAVLDSAVDAMKADSNAVRQLLPRLPHALAVLVEGDTTRALGELDSLATAIFAYGGNGTSVFERSSLDQLARTLGRETSRLLRRRGDIGGALRALSGQSIRGTSTPIVDDNVSAASLAFRRDGDTVLVWVSTANRWSLHRVFFPRTALRRAVAAMDTAHLGDLHARLLEGTVGASLRLLRTLRIDARDDLALVPWAALVDRATSRYVVEQASVELAHNLWQRPRGDRPHVGRVILVNAAPVSGSRTLQGAEEEIAGARRIWGIRAVVIRGTAFDIRRLAVRGTTVTVLHFAGHAVLDARRPTQSYLDLGGDSGQVLRADAFRTISLANVNLIVLAACETRGTPMDAAGAFESLAGAMRHAGAGAVIGATRAIDDAATRYIMEALHRELRAGVAPAQALQRAQQRSIKSADPVLRAPATWAAFQLLGS